MIVEGALATTLCCWCPSADPRVRATSCPFLRNVTAGRDVPAERLAAVAEHYAAFGGVSPINAQNRALVAALADGARAAPRLLGQPQLGSLPAGDAGRRCAPTGWRAPPSSSLRPTPRTPPAGSTAKTWRPPTPATCSWRSCGTTTTIRSSSRRRPSRCSASASAWRRTRGCCSPRIRSRWRRRAPAVPRGGAYPAQLAEAARLVAEQVRERTGWRGSTRSRGRAVPGRRRCRGWSPTSTTGWSRWPPRGCATSSPSRRLRQRSCRGALRPRHRGGGDGGARRHPLRPGGHGRGQPVVCRNGA